LNFVETEIPGVILVEPVVFRDARGFFLETYHVQKYAEGGIRATFVQDNHSLSRYGTLRGLHLQIRHAQGKLIRCVEGAAWDVAVDVRRGSPHFGKHVGVTLSEENMSQLYVPPGFAHGFLVTSDRCQIEYKCTELYHPEDELAIAWNDPQLAIPWPISDVTLSDRDRAAPLLGDVHEHLPVYSPA
jgi:dTDP-4-dehydrorhamnose 3,5-epimerase